MDVQQYKVVHKNEHELKVQDVSVLAIEIQVEIDFELVLYACLFVCELFEKQNGKMTFPYIWIYALLRRSTAQQAGIQEKGKIIVASWEYIHNF